MVGLDLYEVLRELLQRKKNLSFDELCRLLRIGGCRIKETKDGFLVSHTQVPGFMPSVARPHGRAAGNVVRPVYVGKCIRLIELVIEAKEASGGDDDARA
jgi:hypothetical protein